MVRKTLKIVLDVAVSIVVLFVMCLLMDGVLSVIPGTSNTVNNTLKGWATFVMFAVSFVVTIVFAVWFYKFLGRKSKVVKGAVENVGE